MFLFGPEINKVQLIIWIVGGKRSFAASSELCTVGEKFPPSCFCIRVNMLYNIYIEVIYFNLFQVHNLVYKLNV